MEDDNLKSVRTEILNALKTSLIDLTAEAELDPTRRQDANTASRVNWVVEEGRKAFRDLDVFFAGKNVYFYSGQSVAKYIWISCLFNDADSVNAAYSQMENMEEFWLAKDIIRWNDRPENIICIFAKSDSLFPQVKSLNFKRFMSQDFPPSEEICRSAVVALVLLLKSHLSLSIPDLYYLMAESLGHPESYHRPQLLSTLSEEDMCLDTDWDGPWHSITSTAVLPKAFSGSSTKILTFPGTLPQHQTQYNYMDIYQPHGHQPEARSSCANWGARPKLGVVSYNTPPLELKSLLSSHWMNLLRYVYRIGINDGRLILRKAAQDIERIRYSNSAKPSTGSVNVCLMYLNHFDYFKRMTKSLCEEVEIYPPQWRTPNPSKLNPPDWVQEVGRHCETLVEELSMVTGEAKYVRTMILEQKSLLESRKTSLLTLLASIFVPMSFVASFFGMNTVEINGSAWKIKYYFIVAIPLAVLTVLLPLIILPTFHFLLRYLETHSVLRGIIRWTWIIVTLVLNLCLTFRMGTQPNYTMITTTNVLTAVGAGLCM
ncbi:hypothetical protein EG329_000933 [Mollisiaceae sp. DMI_Dod_QoI]|nr:hypothetical protein EG329_000933 [Helotiales sp. DMI_Dod_QoI]